MSDKIYSPDGQMVWDGSSWKPVETNSNENSLADFARNLPQPSSQGYSQNQYPQQTTFVPNTNNNVGQIDNLARVMIDKLNRGDMKTAKECWDKAKMVDLNTTKQVFENKYAHQIAEGYLMIAISELRSFKQLYDNPSTIGIDFKVQVELAPNMVIAALENYTAFVPGHTSFDYNFLYATMWLYCRRFDLVWKREGSQRNFQSYFSKAYELATTIDEYDQLSELKDMWKQQKSDIKSETNTIVILGIVVLVGWIALFAII